MTAQEKVVALAKGEVGYLEKATNSQLYDKTANAGRNNWTKYAYEIATKWPDFFNGNKNGYEWCTTFYCWLFLTLFGLEKARKMLYVPARSLAAGCYYAIRYYKAAGKYGSTPSIGAQIFFKDANGDPCHTGLVYAFDSAKVYTIEGNTSGASGVVSNGGGVAMKSYSRSYSRIDGYGYPDFSVAEEAAVQTGWIQDGNGWWYRLSDGSYPKDCWRQIGGTWYYFDSEGYMVHDTTVTYDGKTYTFDSDGHVTVAGPEKEQEDDDMLTYEQFKAFMRQYEAEVAAQEPGSWSAEAREWAEENGIISGDEKGRKMYKKPVTREEAAVMLFRAENE